MSRESRRCHSHARQRRVGAMDTHEVIRRFESERQTLALMSHPNVAGVLDAGTTAQGRPYFVMEFVDGRMADSPSEGLFCSHFSITKTGAVSQWEFGAKFVTGGDSNIGDVWASRPCRIQMQRIWDFVDNLMHGLLVRICAFPPVFVNPLSLLRQGRCLNSLGLTRSGYPRKWLAKLSLNSEGVPAPYGMQVERYVCFRIDV